LHRPRFFTPLVSVVIFHRLCCKQCDDREENSNDDLTRVDEYQLDDVPLENEDPDSEQ
jgi:hypothetical protein